MRHDIRFALVLTVSWGALCTALPASATTWTVTSTADDGTSATLRSAIVAAASGDTINITATGAITLNCTYGMLEIDKNLTISGPGSDSLGISGNNACNVLQVDSGVTATLSGVAIGGGFSTTSEAGGLDFGYSVGGGVINLGNLTITHGNISGNSAALGAGIFNYRTATLTVSSSTFLNNTASYSGGCIYNDGYGNNSGTVTVSDSTLGRFQIENRAGSGGCISNSYGVVTVSNSAFSGNYATPYGLGGAIYNINGTVMVSNSTFDLNFALFGGCIYNDRDDLLNLPTSGTLTVINSTFRCEALIPEYGYFGYGGGINNYYGQATVSNSTFNGNQADYGGGIANFGTLTVTNSTFSGNAANYYGAGVWNSSGTRTAAISNTTFSGNYAGYGKGAAIYSDGGDASLTVKSTILANSAGYGTGTATNCYSLTNFSPPISAGYNLSDDANTDCSFFNQATDQNSTSAGLDPGGLQANGGPTKTIALMSGSAAIDKIPATPTNYCTDVGGSTVSTDQRGNARPQGAGCDIGAFELGPPEVPAVAFSAFTAKLNVTTLSPGFDLSAAFTLGGTSSGINPITEPVTLTVGTYTVTIAANSFKQLTNGAKKGSYVYSGTLNGIAISEQITPKGANSYSFMASATGVAPATSNPVTVTITIGDDSGTTSVIARLQ